MSETSPQLDVQEAWNELSEVFRAVKTEVPGLIKLVKMDLIDTVAVTDITEKYTRYRLIVEKYLSEAPNLKPVLQVVNEVLSYFHD